MSSNQNDEASLNDDPLFNLDKQIDPATIDDDILFKI